MACNEENMEMGVGNKGNDVLRQRRQRKPHKFTQKRRRRCGSQHYEKWSPSPSNFISIYIARGNDVAVVAYPHEMRQGYQSVKGGLIGYIDPFIYVV